MAAHSSIPAGESHGQRSLESSSPRGHKELDTTERLSTAHVNNSCMSLIEVLLKCCIN